MRRIIACVPVLLLGCNNPPPGVDAGLDSGVTDSGPTADAGSTSDAGQPDAGDAGAADAGPTRQVWLAATGMQTFTTSDPSIFQWTTADLATDVDAVGIFGEFYGIPWAQFAADGGPLPSWAASLQQLASTAGSLQKPIFLSLTIGRDGLINRAVPTADGGYSTQSGWAPCFDFAADGGAQMEAAYGAYVKWMMNTFHPHWVNVAVEINLYGVNCPSAWPGVASTVNNAYTQAKAADPNAVVFESYVLETLYGLANCPTPMTAQECYDAEYARISLLQRDRFGLSTYPNADPATLPADYFVRAANRNDAGPERVVIAETGYNSESIVVGDGVDAGSCTTFVANSPALETSYLQRLLGDAQRYNFELVDWWSDRDLLPEPLMSGCPCTYAADWCALEGFFQKAYPSNPRVGDFLFKAFGSMGLRNYDGSTKPSVLGAWQAVQAVPRDGG